MINFVIDNIFIEFGGRIFQQTSITMGTNCAPVLTDLFLHSYEAEFVQELLRKGEKTDFNSIFHRGSCCSVICVSLVHVIVLSFGFLAHLSRRLK